MKRWGKFVVLLALLGLAGCAAAPADDAALPAQSAPVEEVSKEAEALSVAKTEAAARPLTDEEILAAYDRAVEAYSWFDLSALPSTGAAILVDGWEYYLVDAPGVTNVSDLNLYLRGLFSAEIVERLLATGGEHPLYLDVDGVLYTTAGARGANLYKGVPTAQVEQTEETTYCVNVTVETLAEDMTTVTGLECWSFPYELQGDRWVFTSFCLVY